MGKILEDIGVADLTDHIFGPYCTMILAAHGAELIKIEPPSFFGTLYLGLVYREGERSLLPPAPDTPEDGHGEGGLHQRDRDYDPQHS